MAVARMTSEALAALRSFLADPNQTGTIPADEAAALMASLAAAQVALASRIEAAAVTVRATPSPQTPDRLLTPSEAADRLGVTVRWLYRHAPQLPFTRRLSRKMLRFSEAGLSRYLGGKQRG